jgi:cytochrome c biogenesis protein CcdA
VTHLSFIAASYTLGLAVPVAFAAEAWARMRAAKRRLAVIDTRGGRRR